MLSRTERLHDNINDYANSRAEQNLNHNMNMNAQGRLHSWARHAPAQPSAHHKSRMVTYILVAFVLGFLAQDTMGASADELAQLIDIFLGWYVLALFAYIALVLVHHADNIIGRTLGFFCRPYIRFFDRYNVVGWRYFSPIVAVIVIALVKHFIETI